VSAKLQFHPLAEIFPLIEGVEFDELVEDIRANGLHEPIVVYEDQILDGRNRYRACQAAGIEPAFTVYTGDDPVGYVAAGILTKERRHSREYTREWNNIGSKTWQVIELRLICAILLLRGSREMRKIIARRPRRPSA
jgi:hypothetical protein